MINNAKCSIQIISPPLLSPHFHNPEPVSGSLLVHPSVIRATLAAASPMTLVGHREGRLGSIVIHAGPPHPHLRHPYHRGYGGVVNGVAERFCETYCFLLRGLGPHASIGSSPIISFASPQGCTAKQQWGSSSIQWPHSYRVRHLPHPPLAR